MSRAIRMTALAAVIGVSVSNAPSGLMADVDAPPAWVEQARTGATELARSLMKALSGAMADGGPEAGIEVCRHEAPQIAQQVSEHTDLSVGRTALRVRNPVNAPDDRQRAVLESFEARLAAREPAGRIEHWEESVRGDRVTGHWMKAIPMQPQCSACHGTAVADQLVERIERLYPEDAARGFEPGSLRGAFTVEVDLGPAE